MVLVCACGGVAAWRSARQMDREMRAELLRQTGMIAQTMNMVQVRSLTGTEADLGLPAYQRIKGHFVRLRSTMPQYRFVFLMGRRANGAVYIMVDSESPDSEAYSPPGDLYTEAAREEQAVFDRRTPAVVGPFENRWGTWVTALVPLIDPKDGKLLAVLGMDYDARDWKWSVVSQTALPAGIFAFAALVILVTGSALLLWRDWSSAAKPRWFTYVEPMMTALLGVLLTLFITWLVYHEESQNRRRVFMSLAESRTAVLAETFFTLRNTELESLTRFFEVNYTVSQDTFRHFTEFLDLNPAVKAWQWLPRVPASEVDLFEKGGFAAGIEDLTVWERDAKGNPILVKEREYYYPVSHVVPLDENQGFLGYDHGSDAERYAAIQEAILLKTPTATDCIALLQETGNQRGMLVYSPVFDLQKKGTLKGLIAAVLCPEDVVIDSNADDMVVNELKLVGPAGERESLAIAKASAFLSASDLVARRPVFAFGKTFFITCYAGAAFIGLYPANAALLTFLTGVLLTVALTLVIAILKRRREVLERLVQERTADLCTSEERLAATLRSIADGVIVCDPRGNVISLNEVAESLTGWKSGDASGLSVEEVFKIINVYSRVEAENPVTQVLESGRIIERANHTTLLSKDGGEYQISDSYAPVRNRAGEIVGAVLVFRNVTNEYRRREELRRVKAAMDSTGDAIGMCTAEGTHFYQNAAFTRLFGISLEEMDQMTPAAMYVYPEDAEAVFRTIKRGDSWQGEVEMIGNHGRQMIVQLRADCIKDEENNIVGLIGIHTDITDRKRTEKALKESEARYRELVENANSIILRMDQQGGVVFINEYAQRFFGFKSDEILGKSVVGTIVPETDSSGRDLQAMILDIGQNPDKYLANENENMRRDGTRVWIFWTNKPLYNEGGEVIEILCVGNDITARKQADEALQETNRQLEEAIEHAKRMTAQAEMANVAKGQFLANMSHEIRTPLNGVIGMTGLLLDTELTEEQRRYSEIVKASGESLLGLVNDILDFSKIEAGKMDLEVLDFDLQSLLDDFTASMALRCHDKGLELICTVAPTVPLLLRGDPGRLRQVLTNLTGNAIKFTDCGEVIIRVAVVRYSEQNARGTGGPVMLRFDVCDTGIGIPEDKQERLFQQFSQLDGSTTRKYGGTGLGLAISKQLVALMGGEIGVCSDEGKGSQFWFTAKFEVQMEVPCRERIRPSRLSGVRILIVDDNATSREILKARLLLWNMRPEECEDGASALRELRRASGTGDPYKVAVIDMQMPGMDGETLGRTIRADLRLDDTRLIMLTSLGMRGDARRFQEIGFSAYVTKPVRHEELAGVLGQVLAGDTWANIPEKSIATRHTAREILKPFGRRKARVLLAEDNVTNQQVALAMLRKFGLAADAVANGHEAVAALKALPYDLVLMDVQMPDMDGLEATRKIRSPQSGISNNAIPIIAMTAHTMSGDREKCLDAGMDDYIVKPVNSFALYETLKKWLPSAKQKRESTADKKKGTSDMGSRPGDNEQQGPVVFDRDGIFERLAGDEDLIAEIIETFLDDIPRRIKSLADAVESQDQKNAELESHTIKGSSANIGGEALRALASEMEKAAKEGNFEFIEAHLNDLKEAFDLLKQVMLELK